MLLIIGLFIIILLFLFSVFFPFYYISELIVSFLPYILIFSIIGFVVAVVLLKNQKFRQLNRGKYFQILPLFLLLFALLFFLTSRQYNNFYNADGFAGSGISTDQPGVIVNNMTGLNILYSNILYTNDDYQSLLDFILDKDPDIVLMVEFTNQHDKNLKPLLQDEYPYSARTSWSQKYFGSVVFSKYPIENLTHQIDQGARRYTYFDLVRDNVVYNIYLIHTSSPINYQSFVMRNNQFSILSQDYLQHQKNRDTNEKVLMIGDFNVSPWSYYYKLLAESLSGLINITTGFPILFTWSVKYFPFLQVHIDHVFVSDNVKIGNILKINTPGSDHKGFFIENLR